ncbi:MULTISPECIES: class I SAM-dependent methyltransferase [unclassified Bradyrhizobium]|uniref:class I SAM-dependent methyltransferase n=1 Tax=unclassified Bradyrhizobium TaxID=2631580 RepID=UPI0028E6A754|nr:MULTISPECIES: class I SAM-dependent methyltransferase [unclassified Bradyrhizobium]
MTQMHSSDLAAFVKLVDAHGGDLGHPEVSHLYPISLRYDTRVDDTLSPFSDEYFEQQVALYREVSGRDLDQASGELHPVEIEQLLDAPNPIGIENPAHIAEHVRAVSAMLSIAELGPGARVLDLGAGHGLSSETLAFTSCVVESIDIDPVLNELARRRASRRGLRIIRHTANFDDLASLSDGFDAAFFFQSFHHCLKPWELIGQLRTKLKPDGIIAFTGEPIQANWWKHWGLRLDHESLYVARAFGWFESGWSRQFITDCFVRNGMQLTLFTGGHGGGEIGIATTADASRYRRRAASIGHAVCEEPASAMPMRFATAVGEPCKLHGLEGYRSRGTGWLIYGPYIDLEPGEYEVFCLLRGTGVARFDVIARAGAISMHDETIPTTSGAVALTVQLSISQKLQSVEARVHATGEWSCSRPQFTRIS